jgi:L-serine deaminase
MIVPAALAKKRSAQSPASVKGVYEKFKVGEGSGDLEGMRVVIVSAADGHYAIVQIAQGGAEDPKPEFVAVKVKGMNIEFTVGEQKFTGTVTDSGLRIKGSDGDAQLLKRKPCSSYL